MIRLLLILLLGCLAGFANSQSVTKQSEKQITKTEKQIALLKELGNRMVLSDEYKTRRDANYAFIKQLTRLLKQPNSYHISLDELSFISIQQPEDKAFRIFTWQIETVPGLVRHYGAIQLNQKELQLIPLTDRSDDIDYPELFIGDQRYWYGAIYYKVQAVKSKQGTKYYLYGFDSHNPISNKKLIDVMEFADNDRVIFGNKVFPDVLRPGKQATRFILEYREDASVRLNYNSKLKKIVFDHLIPINEASEGIFANYVPDGTFDALVRKNGIFHWQKNIIATSDQPLNEERKDLENRSLYE